MFGHSSVPVLDMSSGDPGVPFTALFKRACRKSAADIQRYHQINTCNVDCTTWDFLKPVAKHFESKGIKCSGSNILFSGGGTSEVFEYILKMLMSDVREENKKRKTPIKPAIAFTVPTYGLFIEKAERAGFDIIKVPRDLKTGALSQKLLKQALVQSHHDGLRVVGFCDPNPHNPLGLVRGLQETKEIGTLLQALSGDYKILDDKAESAGMPWKGPASRVRMLDDLIYDGLEYSHEKPVSFAQIPEFFNDTLVMYGLSKIGLTGLRAGLAIGNTTDIAELRVIAQEYSYFPNTVAMHAMAEYYNNGKTQTQMRETHLTEAKETYRFSGVFMKALINGVHQTPEASADDKENMRLALTMHLGISERAAIQKLKDGVSGVSVLTTPQAGFFHLLDFNALRNQTVCLNMKESEQYREWSKVDAEDSLYHVFTTHHGLHVLGPSAMGLADDAMVGRVSFAADDSDIIDCAERLRAGVRHFRP